MANVPHLVIDAKRAAELYDRLGDWKAVAKAMPRPDGSHFTSYALCCAVHQLDKGTRHGDHDRHRQPRG